MMRYLGILLLVPALLLGCGGREPGSTNLTKGPLRLECDEAIYPVMKLEAEEFQRQYADARITVRPVEAREAIANFANDSVQVIVCARPFNKEERDALAGAKIEFQEYKVAVTAVAVIAHKGAPVARLRTGELDSIFSGVITRWPGARVRGNIDLAIGGVNSSTNEVFRNVVLHGKQVTPSATPLSSSKELVDYVRKTPNGLGIVGVNWLKDLQQEVTVLAICDPLAPPDSTVPPGQYYTPAQAYIHQGWYPVSTPVYMYSREAERAVGTGLISFVCSAPGQKIILNDGLVPATMPVRIVQLTSQQVK